MKKHTKCVTCKSELTGLKRKYCSTPCKHRETNNKHQNYKAQKKRGLIRKKKLVKLLGGKCEICGYTKCLSALVFHHKNPKTKTIKLDIRSCSNHS